MSDLSLIIDLFNRVKRQGPGSEQAITQAVALANLNQHQPLDLLEIGCGTGATSRQLTKQTHFNITAVDLFPEFLQKIQSDNLTNLVPLAADMNQLPFKEDAFDIILSEGAIYNMGFEKGLAAWHPFLKEGGTLILSEITWLTKERPKALTDYWEAAYPEVDLASNKIAQLEQAGFMLKGYFPLSESCWLDEYYTPLEAQFDQYLTDHNHSKDALAVIQANQEEIALYKASKAYFSYGMYIAKKTST